MTKEGNIKNFVKSQPLFDVHWQWYVQMVLIDLQAKVVVEVFAVLLIFSKFSSIIIGYYLL